MAHPYQVELVGGPLNGVVHELGDFPMPAAIGLTAPNEHADHGPAKVMHWYVTADTSPGEQPRAMYRETTPHHDNA